jgi:hypothetical protein
MMLCKIVAFVFQFLNVIWLIYIDYFEICQMVVFSMMAGSVFSI